ncbi:MAG: Ig domain-containing protein [Planctomycetes bacterium]|nr:Ig domain-containing protein [Planctomycetota bacterium]
MTPIQRIRVLLAAVFAVVCSSAALAQDYTAAFLTSSSAYQTPPGNQKTIPVNGATAPGPGGSFVTLPFEFPFYGVKYSQVWVCSQGFIQFGVTGASGSLQYLNASWPPSGTEDGMCAVLWDDLNVDPSNGGRGAVQHWTIGTAPNRTWIVSWEGIPVYGAGASSAVTPQIQLYEATGRIIFAYKSDTGGAWTGLSYSAGIDAPSTTTLDARSQAGGCVLTGFFNPQPTITASSNLSGHPIRDVQFTPFQYTYSGTVTYDRLLATGTGINGVQSGVPLSGLTVELRRQDGSLGFKSTTDSSGAFSITSTGADRSKLGSLVVVAENPSCVIRAASTAGATIQSYTLQANVALNAGLAIGARNIGSTQDATGDLRAALNIALVVQDTADWIAARTTKAISKLTIVYNTSSATPTGFTYAGLNNVPPNLMQVGSAGSPNPDAWDPWIIRRQYARHVLANIAFPSTKTVDTRLDAATDAENAFPEAFGVYLHTAMTGDTTLFDGTSATTATTLNLEAPAFTSPAGSNVIGRVAAGLFDLVDPANEAWDAIDGSGTAAARPLAVAETLRTPVTADAFYQAWNTAGFDGFALSRVFIKDGVVADDASESNDSSAEPTAVGSVTVQRQNLTLNPFNEDWFEFQKTGAASAVAAEVSFNRETYITNVSVQVLDTAGNVIVTGAPVGTSGPFRATTGSLAAGTYRMRVRHVSGPAVPSYSIQVYPPISFLSSQGSGWTVGRALTVNLTAAGGIPPYTIAIVAPAVLPDGLTLDATNYRITGTPTTAGNGTLAVTLTDSGTPAHVLVAGGAFAVNAPVDVRPGVFTPFALGRTHARAASIGGGTTPMAATVTGSLPAGLAFNGGTRQFTGAPSAAGAFPYHLDVTDAAGSTDGADSTAVVCAPLGATASLVSLAAGDTACGYFFDLVEGSSATVKIATAKGGARRTLAAAILGPDGQPIAGAVAKGGAGSASVTRLRAARSGRYFVVLSSKSGDATQLTGTVKAVVPAKAAAKLANVTPGQTITIKFGALPGTVLALKATPDAASGGKIGIFAVTDPAGNLVDLATDLSLKIVANGVQLGGTLTKGGTWTIGLLCQPGNAAKKVAWSYTLKPVKGAVFDANLGGGE